MIRQLAICSTKDGVIGMNDGLFVSIRRDMANFNKFTSGTVMVAGKNTAQEMVDHGVVPKDSRPMVVITSHKQGIDTTADNRNIYYAEDPENAIFLAEAIAKEYGLIGYTVVGGKAIYEHYLRNGAMYDAIYLTTVNLSSASGLAGAVTIGVSDVVDRFERCIDGPMVSKFIPAMMHDKQSNQLIGVDFNYFYAKKTYNPDGITVSVDGVMTVQDVHHGKVSFNLNEVDSYSVDRSDTINLRIRGTCINLTPANRAGNINFIINSLKKSRF